MPAEPRLVSIQNRHPRLRVPLRDLRRVIALLDEHFRIVPADLATFAPARARAHRVALRDSKIKNQKSKILPACPPGELSLVFLTDDALARIHADFMDDPTPTDVITFEGDQAAGLAGEICVSADTAAAYVRASGGDFAAELTLYLVHGWLHLAGYDDLWPDRKRRMRAAEKRALRVLTEHDAIPAFRLR
jgi:probable rRNA maturation factor